MSRMWTPTHCKVTILKARNLVSKGIKAANESYVTIQLGKEKYQTSMVEKSEAPVWDEECDLPLVNMYATLNINVYNRVMLGIDEFLGNVSLNLSDFPVYECAKSRFYPLKNKPGKKETGYRGELEVRVTFVVLNKHGRKSEKRSRTASVDHVRQVASNVGGRIQRTLSVGSASLPGVKKPPETLAEPFLKQQITSRNDTYFDEEDHADTFLTSNSPSMEISGSFPSNSTVNSHDNVFTIAPQKECPAPRQPSSFLRALSESTSSADRKKTAAEGTEVPLLAAENSKEEFTRDDGATPLLTGLMDGFQDTSDLAGITMSVSEMKMPLGESKILFKPDTPPATRRQYKQCKEVSKTERRYTITGELPSVDAFQLMSWEEYENKRKDKEKEGLEQCKKKYEHMNRDDLTEVIYHQEEHSDRQTHYIRDLENYIDLLLVRVMATTPKILQNPYDGPGAM